MITELEINYEKFPISKIKNVEVLEEKILSMPQVPCPVTHRFGPNLYMREVFLPKGALVIGHHQNFEHMNVFIKGKITFFGDNGPIEMTAPMSFVGKPGRKIAYIHEDSIWMNVYSTKETDVEKLESHYLTKSGTFEMNKIENEKVLHLTSDLDKKDFEMFCRDFGFSQDYVRSISENKADMIDLPFGSFKFKTGKSNIEGLGLIATGNIKENELIGPARIFGKRTIIGRYTNHSLFPNAKMVKGDGYLNGNISEIDLIATKEIRGCNGGQDGEEITIDYREAFRLTKEIEETKCQQ